MLRSASFTLFILPALILGGVPVATAVSYQQPPWKQSALKHIIYENESTQADTIRFAEEFLNHQIPVDWIIVDAPWEDYYNTFDWDLNLYPDPATMVDTLHGLGVRVLMWITANVNDDAPNYNYAKDQGYLLSNGATAHWWHGDGAYVDYTNPEAVDWWHEQMDKLLDLGIDGWKCDGSDPLIILLGLAIGKGGIIAPWDYGSYYYTDFLNYTRQVRGPESIILSRPVDSFEGFVDWAFTPRESLVCGWTGDHDADFVGLRQGLHNMLSSGDANYVNFGSEIGGFRSGIRTKELFVRWAQMSAFCGVYINGGNGEHRPWMYDSECEEIYKECTDIHYKLIPYLYSQGADAWWAGTAMQVRSGGLLSNNYTLGEALFIAPITDSAADAPTRQVAFPVGDWINWYNDLEYHGPVTKYLTYALDEYPAYIKKGSIIPMYRSMYEADIADPIEVNIYFPDGTKEFKVYEEEGPGFLLQYETTSKLTVTSTQTNRLLDFKIHQTRAPLDVRVGSLVNMPKRVVSGINREAKILSWTWHWDPVDRVLTVKNVPARNGVTLTVY